MNSTWIKSSISVFFIYTCALYLKVCKDIVSTSRLRKNRFHSLEYLERNCRWYCAVQQRGSSSATGACSNLLPGGFIVWICGTCWRWMRIIVVKPATSLLCWRLSRFCWLCWVLSSIIFFTLSCILPKMLRPVIFAPTRGRSSRGKNEFVPCRGAPSLHRPATSSLF